MRVTPTKIAFDDLAGCLGVIDGAERAGNGADLAADALVVGNHLGTGRKIDADRIHRTGTHAPGFVTLGTGIGCESPLVMESENLYVRS